MFDKATDEQIARVQHIYPSRKIAAIVWGQEFIPVVVVFEDRSWESFPPIDDEAIEYLLRDL
jgi:hypothetical protein